MHGICVILNSKYLDNNVDFSSANFGNITVFIFGAISGTVAWCCIAKVIPIKALEFVGKNSLTYYGIHFFFISIISFATQNSVVIAIGTFFATTVTVIIYNKLGVNKLFKGRFKA